MNDNNLVYNAYSDEFSRDAGFSHKIKLFLGKIIVFICMGRSKYNFQSKNTTAKKKKKKKKKRKKKKKKRKKKKKEKKKKNKKKFMLVVQ